MKELICWLVGAVSMCALAVLIVLFVFLMEKFYYRDKAGFYTFSFLSAAGVSYWVGCAVLSFLRG